ncbi:MAG: PEGA domain-containing protein [Proteobacteria bacterium]|nr:PEGA domain-containing protein [Pseudomonadota bacterium]
MLRIVSQAASIEHFARLYTRFYNRDGLFIVTLEPADVGTRDQFAIVLDSGEPVIQGECEIIDTYHDRDNRYNHAGMKLRLLDLDEPSRRLVQHLASAKSARERRPSGEIATQRSENGYNDQSAAAYADTDELPVVDAEHSSEATVEELDKAATCEVHHEDNSSVPAKARGTAVGPDHQGNALDEVAGETRSRSFAEVAAPSSFENEPSVVVSGMGIATGNRGDDDTGVEDEWAASGSDFAEFEPTGDSLGPGPAATSPAESQSARTEPAVGPSPAAPSTGPTAPLNASPRAAPKNLSAVGSSPNVGYSRLPLPLSPTTTPTPVPVVRTPRGKSSARYTGQHSYRTELLPKLRLDSKWVVPALAAGVSAMIGLGSGYLIWGNSPEPSARNAMRLRDASMQAAPPRSPKIPAQNADNRTQNPVTLVREPDNRAPKPVNRPRNARQDSEVQSPSRTLRAARNRNRVAKTNAIDPAANNRRGSGNCRVRLASSPRQATVYVGKRNLGATPANIRLPCGKTTFRFERRRYQSVTKSITLMPRQSNSVAIRLQRPRVQFQVASTPSGATVTLAGKEVGETPLSIEIAGYEFTQLVVRKTGHRPYRKRIYPRPPKFDIQATLSPRSK